MATYYSKETQITVVCEYRLNGDCNKESCAAYKENSISLSGTHEIKATGQRYYPYNCQRKDCEVKLLDIHFQLKDNPNFLFKHRKIRR